MRTFSANLGMKGPDFIAGPHQNLNQMDLQIFWPSLDFGLWASFHGNNKFKVPQCRILSEVAHIWLSITEKNVQTSFRQK